MEVSSLPRAGDGIVPRSRRFFLPLSDERLVGAVRHGNEAAFEAVYDRHHRGLLAFCRHMLASQEEAEDAVQQTFISAYGDLTSSDKPIRLKPWLYTIARNRCLSILRARREETVEALEVPTAGLSDAVLEREDLRRLLADVRALPEDQRAAIVLSEIGDLSHAEIAEVVGCETVKVKALVFQARSSLLESRRARETPCHEIREQLSTLRGSALRAGSLRRHLRACTGCSEFNEQVRRQRQMFALALPVVPSMGFKQGVLAAAGLAPGAAGGVAAGGALAGGAATSGVAGSTGAGVAAGVGGTGLGSTLSGLGAAGLAKLAVVTVVAVGGGLAVNHAVSVTGSHRGAPGASHNSNPNGGGASSNGVSNAPGSAGAGQGTNGAHGKSGAAHGKAAANGASAKQAHKHGKNASAGGATSSSKAKYSHHGGNGKSHGHVVGSSSSGLVTSGSSDGVSDTSPSHAHTVPPQAHHGQPAEHPPHPDHPPPGSKSHAEAPPP